MTIISKIKEFFTGEIIPQEGEFYWVKEMRSLRSYHLHAPIILQYAGSYWISPWNPRIKTEIFHRGQFKAVKHIKHLTGE